MSEYETNLILDVPLDDAPEAAEAPRLPVGWINVILVGTEVRQNDETADEPKANIFFEFRTSMDSPYPDVPVYGVAGWPLKTDQLIETRVRKAGGGFMTRAELKMTVLKAVANALGATGLRLSPDMFAPYYGRELSVKLEPEEYQGEVRNRIPFGFNFGRNVRPA